MRAVVLREKGGPEVLTIENVPDPSPGPGEILVDVAHTTMVTRQRDLDAFAYADPNDVSLVDDDDLQFVLHGVTPERRFLLETLYGFVVLKNGVEPGGTNP